jgi:hypothetical protein
LKKFSEVVYGLAHESEPHKARVSFLEKLKLEDQKLRERGLESAGSIPSIEEVIESKWPKLAPSTLVHSCKDRYIIRSQHDQVGQLKFIPTNPAQAKLDLKSNYEHDLGESSITL